MQTAAPTLPIALTIILTMTGMSSVVSLSQTVPEMASRKDRLPSTVPRMSTQYVSSFLTW